jgi:hypothetical protein
MPDYRAQWHDLCSGLTAPEKRRMETRLRVLIGLVPCPPDTAIDAELWCLRGVILSERVK